MKLAPFDFGYSYITRSGRIDDDQLRAASPRFMERYDAHSSHQNESRSAENSHVG
jgi:hypothetical protein